MYTATCGVHPLRVMHLKSGPDCERGMDLMAGNGFTVYTVQVVLLRHNVVSYTPAILGRPSCAHWYHNTCNLLQV